MQRILKLFLIVCCFISCSLVLADTEERKAGVFFCTCDIASSESKDQPSNKSLAGRPNSFIVVEEHDSPRHSHVRHCFLMLATKVEGILKNKLVLDISAAIGYYHNPKPGNENGGAVFAEDPWLLNAEARKQYAISCTPVIQEGTVGANKVSPNVAITESDINDAWVQLYQAMWKDSIKNPAYDRDTHNCCNVSFGSLRTVRDGSKEFSLDLSHIKKRIFNVLGRGISFDNNDDSILDYIEGGGRIVSDSLSISPKVIIRSIMDVTGSEYVEAEHDDDKEEL